MCSHTAYKLLWNISLSYLLSYISIDIEDKTKLRKLAKEKLSLANTTKSKKVCVSVFMICKYI